MKTETPRPWNLGNYKYISGASRAVRLAAKSIVRDRGGIIRERFVRTRSWGEGVEWVADIEPYGWLVVSIEDHPPLDARPLTSHGAGVTTETHYYMTVCSDRDVYWLVFLRYAPAPTPEASRNPNLEQRTMKLEHAMPHLLAYASQCGQDHRNHCYTSSYYRDTYRRWRDRCVTSLGLDRHELDCAYVNGWWSVGR
jgi:hypothetical protein